MSQAVKANLVLVGLCVFVMIISSHRFVLANNIQSETAQYVDEYGDMFNKVLENLRTNYWSPDGDWRGDDSYSASSMSLHILYRYGTDTNDQDLIDKADATIDRSFDLLLEVLGGDTSNMVEAFVGIGGGIYALEYPYGGRHQALPMELIGWTTYLGTGLLLQEDPNPLGDFIGYIFSMGVFSAGGIDYARIVRGPLGFTAASWGLDAIEAANQDYWVQEIVGDITHGHYYDPNPYHHGSLPMYGFANAPMLMALAKAYGVTHKEEYLEKATALIAAFDSHLWDAARGGYFPYLNTTAKYLSDNSGFASGLLELYNVTGETMFLEKAGDILDFIENDLLIEDPSMPGHFICADHWRYNSGASEAYCTGTNFGMLDAVYSFNKLLQNGPMYPGRILICGQIPPGQSEWRSGCVYMVVLFLPGACIFLMRQSYRRHLIKDVRR